MTLGVMWLSSAARESSPYLLTYGEDHLVGPLTLDVFILDEMGFSPQSNFFQGANRSVISSIASSNDPMKIAVVKADFEQFAIDLGSDAATMKTRI